jgi:PAS domain S-box-containing protein
MFSRLSLRYRIALVIFLLEACMLAAVLSVSLSQSKRTAADFDAASQKASLDLLSNLSVTALLTSEYSDYQLYLDDVQKQPSIVRIVLADPNRRIVASSQVTDVGRQMSDVLNEQESGWRIKPVNSAAGVLGTLAVQFSDAALVAAYINTRNLAFAIAVTGMIVIALVGLATGFALTRRLQRVTDAVQQFAAGDRQARSQVTGWDEVALLSRNFDQMADAVAEQQRQLREQSEDISLLLNSTAEAIYGVNTKGICTFVNPACLRILGYKHESDLVGKNIHGLIHHTYPDGRPYPREECKVRLSTIEGLEAHADDEVHWRADGSSIPVEYWSHPMYRDNTLIGAVVTFVDISARRQVEAELRQHRDELEQRVKSRTAELSAANQELEAFSYSVSHDLRAPLRAIDGFSSILIEDYATQFDPEAKRYFQRIRDAVQRMGVLIDELLELSRVGRTEMRLTSVDLSAIAGEVVETLQNGEPQRRVHVTLTPGLVAHGDERLLRLLLQNLVDNAWKYTRHVPAAHIDFGMRSEADETVYYVRDNGAGFDMVFADKLFQPFQRLHRPEDFEGTGVGLAIVARIIKRHGGRIWVEATVGQGATFFFTLAAPA